MAKAAGNPPRLLLLDLFLGWRGIRFAAHTLGLEIELDVDAEVDSFARLVSEVRWPKCSRWGDVKHISEEQIRAAIADAGPRVDGILISAGFPCKDLSRLKCSRQNLAGPESGKFRYILLALEWAKRHAKNIPVHFLVENTIMDAEPMRAISMALAASPIRIDAKEVCAARRDRLYWLSWEVAPRLQAAPPPSFCRAPLAARAKQKPYT